MPGPWCHARRRRRHRQRRRGGGKCPEPIVQQQRRSAEGVRVQCDTRRRVWSPPALVAQRVSNRRRAPAAARAALSTPPCDGQSNASPPSTGTCRRRPTGSCDDCSRTRYAAGRSINPMPKPGCQLLASCRASARSAAVIADSTSAVSRRFMESQPNSIRVSTPTAHRPMTAPHRTPPPTQTQSARGCTDAPDFVRVHRRGALVPRP